MEVAARSDLSRTATAASRCWSGAVEQSFTASPVPLALRLTGSSWHSVTVHAPSNGQVNVVAFAPGGGAWTAGWTGKSTLILHWNGKA